MAIVTRSRDEDKYQGTRATPSLKALIHNGVAGVSFSRTQEGVEVATAIAPVRGTPWWVVAGVPKAELAESYQSPLWQLALGAAMTLIISMGFSVAALRYWGRKPKRRFQGLLSGRTKPQ